MSHPLPALHVLVSHFEALVRRGQQRVWMSDEARTALKEIIRMKPGRMVFARPVPALPKDRTDKPDRTPAPPAAIVAPPESSPSPTPAPPTDRRARLAAVAARAEASPAARALGTLREKMVFATGSPDAQIMLVGEAPGAQEERLGEPFVGPAGQLLDKILKAMGLDRTSVYITNLCKFRPLVAGDQGTSNREPTGAEMNACMEYLLEEIAIIQPRVIIALGKTAAEGLLQRDVAITRLRGQWQEFQGIPLMPTFHPSYLKRKEDEGEDIAKVEKRKHWEDMLAVMERLGVPVSDKQRRFFLPKERAEG